MEDFANVRMPSAHGELGEEAASPLGVSNLAPEPGIGRG